MRFLQLLRKYINRTKDDIHDAEPILEFSYPALINSSMEAERFISHLVKEAKEKASELGYEIDAIVFHMAFDSPTIFKYNNIRSNSDDYVAIMRKKDGSCVAVIFSGAWISGA